MPPTRKPCATPTCCRPARRSPERVGDRVDRGGTIGRGREMKHRLLTVGLSSLLGLTFALRVAAAATTPAAPPPEKPFEETTDVVAVEVPVNVVGRDGLSVRGLQAADFEVFDEGQQQKI